MAGNIWDLLDAILDHYWTPAGRFAVWLVAFTFLFSQFGTNFGANSIPFGADMTGLFPRLLTIRRGQVLCAVLGVAVLPWQLIANAGAFLSFLSSYNIFMAPLCAVSLPLLVPIFLLVLIRSFSFVIQLSKDTLTGN